MIAGGAYAGKRRYLRSRESHVHWHSAYDGKQWSDWQTAWEQAIATSSILVLEGLELWIAEALKQGHSADAVRKEYRAVLHELKQLEDVRREEANDSASHDHHVAILMLEMGRGIVPMQANERALRDTAGWLQQDAASLSSEAVYIWHGLPRVMKQTLVNPELD